MPDVKTDRSSPLPFLAADNARPLGDSAAPDSAITPHQDDLFELLTPSVRLAIRNDGWVNFTPYPALGEPCFFNGSDDHATLGFDLESTFALSDQWRLGFDAHSTLMHTPAYPWWLDNGTFYEQRDFTLSAGRIDVLGAESAARLNVSLRERTHDTRTASPEGLRALVHRAYHYEQPDLIAGGPDRTGFAVGFDLEKGRTFGVTEHQALRLSVDASANFDFSHSESRASLGAWADYKVASAAGGWNASLGVGVSALSFFAIGGFDPEVATQYRDSFGLSAGLRLQAGYGGFKIYGQYDSNDQNVGRNTMTLLHGEHARITLGLGWVF